MSKIKHTVYESNPEWNSIEIDGNWSTWSVEGNLYGEVQIECTEYQGNTMQLSLDQEELIEFIQFLQTKVQ